MTNAELCRRLRDLSSSWQPLPIAFEAADAIDSLTARAEKAEAALRDGWQDMDSAPRDGTNILVWAECFEWPKVVRYELYDEATAGEVGEAGYWRYSEDIIADVANVEDETVTHWRPLPAPPAALSAIGEA